MHPACHETDRRGTVHEGWQKELQSDANVTPSLSFVTPAKAGVQTSPLLVRLLLHANGGTLDARSGRA